MKSFIIGYNIGRKLTASSLSVEKKKEFTKWKANSLNFSSVKSITDFADGMNVGFLYPTIPDLFFKKIALPITYFIVFWILTPIVLLLKVINLISKEKCVAFVNYGLEVKKLRDKKKWEEFCNTKVKIFKEIYLLIASNNDATTEEMIDVFIKHKITNPDLIQSVLEELNAKMNEVSNEP